MTNYILKKNKQKKKKYEIITDKKQYTDNDIMMIIHF